MEAEEADCRTGKNALCVAGLRSLLYGYASWLTSGTIGLSVPTELNIHDLPYSRTGKVLSWVARQNLWMLVVCGVGLYFGFAIIVSVIEFAAQSAGCFLVAGDTNTKPVDWWDILYFNLITILTVGYGDFHPVSYGKGLSVAEAFIGVGLFSILVSVLTVKALLPPKNAIIFSRHAFYCTKPECFLIIFVNTTGQRLGNVIISAYFKLGGDWGVRPSITAPFITQSVQTFYIKKVKQTHLIDRLREGDCLRVGVNAGMGFSNFATFVQYDVDEILVIPDRANLIEFFEPRWKPNFDDPEFRKVFHYGCVATAPVLIASVEQARRSQSETLEFGPVDEFVPPARPPRA
jgi:hypothetical protein